MGHHCWPGTGHWDRPEVALFDISIPDIGCRYIDTFKNIDIDIDIDKDILENIDIDIDIDKEILENIDIDIDKEILENIDMGVIKIPIKQWYKMGAKSDHFPM